MFEILILLALAKIQDNYPNSPTWQWALGFAIFSLLFSIVGDNGIIGSMMSCILIGLYSWGYFAVLRQLTDHLLWWLLACFIGAILPFFLMMSIIA